MNKTATLVSFVEHLMLMAGLIMDKAVSSDDKVLSLMSAVVFSALPLFSLANCLEESKKVW